MTSGLGGGGVGAMIAGARELSSNNTLQQGLSPGANLVSTGAHQPTYISPVDRTQGMGVQQLQGMGLPPNIPNSDLLVSFEVVLRTVPTNSKVFLPRLMIMQEMWILKSVI